MNMLRRTLNETASLSPKKTGLKSATLWLCNQPADCKNGQHSEYRVRAMVGGRNIYFPFDPKSLVLKAPKPTSDFKEGEISSLLKEIEEFIDKNNVLIKAYISKEEDDDGNVKVDIDILRNSIKPIGKK